MLHLLYSDNLLDLDFLKIHHIWLRDFELHFPGYQRTKHCQSNILLTRGQCNYQVYSTFLQQYLVSTEYLLLLTRTVPTKCKLTLDTQYSQALSIEYWVDTRFSILETSIQVEHLYYSYEFHALNSELSDLHSFNTFVERWNVCRLRICSAIFWRILHRNSNCWWINRKRKRVYFKAYLQGGLPSKLEWKILVTC